MKRYTTPGALGLLKPLQNWLSDPEVSEILLNKPGEIYIEKKGQLQRYTVPALNLSLLIHLFQLIANENHQEISESKPLLAGNLADGSRIQLVFPPTARYPTFAIRRKVIQNMGLAEYEKKGFYQHVVMFTQRERSTIELSEKERVLQHAYRTENWPLFIREALALKKNIVISGGTSSGKTTFLTACLRQIPETERILLLEDTREVQISHPNQVNLLSYKNEQGLANVSMQDLVQCALRLRPDRIILGEIRGREILDFLGASSTGHEGSITSIHASNPQIALMRMKQLYKQNNVPSMTDEDILQEIHTVVDIIIQLTKGTRGRYVQSIYYKDGLSGE
jgi:type IV secretion system protein VirB11